jgi:transcriptional antiterminator RfaH
MPILTREPDIYPANLFEELVLGEPEDRQWWGLYTLSRKEKELMRRLSAMQIPFYCPVIEKRTKSPAGRVRKSYLPLFSNYVFLFGRADERYRALETNCVCSTLEVIDGSELTRDLHQFHELIARNVPLTPESKLQAGERVRVRRGKFHGIEGTVIRREGEVRLLVAVNFIQQGASMLLDECEVELI